jgi:ribonuclease J
MNTYKLHFVPLGGIMGVTKNMYVYELYQDDLLKDILIVDCGIGFPQEKELGVDFVIPDITYLKDKLDKIRAILLTHGHEDHISALPFHYSPLGRPPIFTSKLTAAFVNNKFKEFDKRPKINQVDFNCEYTLGNFQVKFINVTHSIPDTTHILIKTTAGTIYHGADFKFDLTPPYGPTPNFYEIIKAGKMGILCLLSDCLGAEREGLTLSENIVGQTFENEMRKTKGKFIMTTFSSNISRIRQCVQAAKTFNRKIVFLGRSMKENTKIATEINYLPIPKSLQIKEEEVMKLPPNKVCLIAAGSQGQYDSALAKLAHRQNKNIAIKPGDKVIFSSDPIPGNENEVYALIEDLTLQGADVVYGDIKEELHASGHGNQEDLKLLARFTNPQYFIPIGGTIRHQRQYQKLMEELGFSKDKIFMLDEGQTLWFFQNKAILGKEVETRNIYIDAYGIGDVGNLILRDRQSLASDGIVITFIIFDNQLRLITQPKIITRGVIYEKNEQKLLKNAVLLIQSLTKPKGERVKDLGNIKKEIGKKLEEFFLQERGRKPLIVVDIIQI